MSAARVADSDSAMPAAVLQMMGFEKVYSLLGGFEGWEQPQMPVKREARYS
jgi:rhodanese-related sulfurtransferase